jgi:hypothetical protein
MPTIDSDGCRPLVPSHADHFSDPVGIGGRHRSDSVVFDNIKQGHLTEI